MSDFTEPFLTPSWLQAATLASRFMQPQSMSNAPNANSDKIDLINVADLQDLGVGGPPKLQ